jgi:hypothetical protein
MWGQIHKMALGKIKSYDSLLKMWKKENKENLETASPSISEKPSYAEIKQTIESSFSKDASGQFLDQAAVLDMLGTMAAEYNDQQILDLYYYNEADGQFYWNEELLNR